MAIAFRQITASTLILVLALTSVALGVARGQARAEDQVVVCSGHGAVTIWIDDQGQPVNPPQYCPDCVLSLLEAVGSPGLAPSPPTTLVSATVSAGQSLAVATIETHTPGARGPPDLV